MSKPPRFKILRHPADKCDCPVTQCWTPRLSNSPYCATCRDFCVPAKRNDRRKIAAAIIGWLILAAIVAALWIGR